MTPRHGRSANTHRVSFIFVCLLGRFACRALYKMVAATRHRSWNSLGTLIIPFSISRRFVGSTNSRVPASPSRELLPTYPTVHSGTVYWTGTLMVVEDDGTPNCGIWYAGIMSFVSALPPVKIMKGLGRLRIDTSVRGGVSRGGSVVFLVVC